MWSQKYKWITNLLAIECETYITRKETLLMLKTLIVLVT